LRRADRLLAGATAVVLAMLPMQRASAAPRPLPEEWWFSAWGIQSDVWPVTKGAGVTVAVLDTGVNARLPELAGAVLKGTDATGAKNDGRKDLDEKDGGHGTGMAALIAGQGGGTTGYLGIAPAAKILPVRVASNFGDKVGFIDALAGGIRYAVAHGAAVINIAQGSVSQLAPNHCDPGIQRAIADAIDHDVVVVASAGNEGNTTNLPILPASCAGVLAVGAITPALRPWKGTQRQSYVALSAPGDSAGTIDMQGQYYPDTWGTSVACALTSGAIALIRSRNPRMPARTVVQRLMATARPLGKHGWNNQTGYGAIQITSAMNPRRYPVAPNAPNPVYGAFEKWRASQHQPLPKASPASAGSNHEPKQRPSLWHRPDLFVASGVLGALSIAVLFTLCLAWRRRGLTDGRHQVRSDADGFGDGGVPG
jgi:membrane-anchored mycosin MYCP